jgi:hypothetical protein
MSAQIFSLIRKNCAAGLKPSFAIRALGSGFPAFCGCAASKGANTSNERAVLWMSVLILIALGFILGQFAAVSIAATVALYLVYERSVGSKAPSAALHA